MSNKILFVFEGEVRENNIARSLKTHVLTQGQVITCAFKADIYQLYTQISADDYLDIFTLITGRDENLKQFCRDDFAEIYLFFDYDAHATMSPKEKDGDIVLRAMLEKFDNETEMGKLYISYPMVEALWHIENFENFENLNVKCKGHNCFYKVDCQEYNECVNEPHYKELVGSTSISSLRAINSYDASIWHKIIKAHLCKMNYVLTNNNVFPLQISSQAAIFACQYDKYINKRCPSVAVLSAFPIFVHDYYGNLKVRNDLGID